MNYVPISSSNIDAVGFESDSQILAVSFRNGSEYHYYNVPAVHFEAIQAAASPGNYLDTYIKKAGYSYARVR